MATIKRVDRNHRSNDYFLFMEGETLVFRRNNLDVDFFTQTKGEWKFAEEVILYGRWCSFSIEGPGKIKGYFPTEGDVLCMKGGFHSFGVELRIHLKKDPPFVVEGTDEDIKFRFECRGNKKIAVRDQHGRLIVPMERGKPKSEKRTELNSSAWDVAHTIQGGSATPR